ncbi:RagB/SusD family nutrient uptake outer membrane protein [Tenacibaculum sp. C7A-26P2]|uniref:RagB/SusD family nutrient uptake outer membrane protein n=1 Tax=Tenacibaculum sp. C7A-26P2 TaxID=3447504 RepID=UPI003F851805
MKKIIKLYKVSFIALLLSISACNDNLDLKPEDSIEQSVVLTSPNLIKGAVTGIYSKLQDSDIYGQPQMVAEFMADNVDFVGSFPSLRDIRDYQTLATNRSIDGYWIDTFENIAATNFIITNFPAISSNLITEAEKRSYIAQAKFIRALSNFELVNLFAQPYQFSSGTNLGIPLVFEFFKGDISPFQKERSTLNEVHNQIESDLNDAIANLPNGSNGSASKGAAQALLARLYLYREQWSNAANLANEVIQSGQYSLSSNYDFYNDKSENPEHIFTVINSSADPIVGSGSTAFYNAAPLGRGDAPFSQNLIDAFNDEAGDLRFSDLSVAAADAGGNNTFFTTKYSDGTNAASLSPVLRITEMYLIRAEANLNAGSSIGDTPLNDINRLRSRAGLPALASVNIDQILTERRKELCFEGHRRMDLLRNNRNLRPDNGVESAPGADKVILPIPDDEMNLNPNITQSPGSF